MKNIIKAITLILTISLCLTAAVPASGLTEGEEIERGLEWERLNSAYWQVYSMLHRVGDDFTGYYIRTLSGASAAAWELLDLPDSSTEEIRDMSAELEYLISEQDNPANHSRAGFYTVAFTNNFSWSENISVYCWNDAGDPYDFPWPGMAMVGGYINVYGQRQYYAYIPEDFNHICFSAGQIVPPEGYYAPCVEVQTEDITVTADTGYYLTGKADGQFHYTVASWELKAPVYRDYGQPAPPVPTEAPTETPTETPTESPTSAATEMPTQQATEPVHEPDIDRYFPMSDGLLDFYTEPSGSPARRELHSLLVEATVMLAPGGSLSDAQREKLTRLRNFAVNVYNYKDSADHELTGAAEMLRMAMDDRSYEDIILSMKHYFIVADSYSSDPLTDHIRGDADGDGIVTIIDATRVQRVLAGYDAEHRPEAERYAALTGDSLSILDATLIQRHLAGLPTQQPVGDHFS